MKNSTNIIGYLAAFSVMITATFKFNHLEGAALVMVFTGILLSIYFPMYIIDKMRDEAGGKRLPSHMLAATCASLLNFAILFKILHWYGANLLLVLGLAGFSLVLIPMVLIQKLKQPGENKIMNAAGAMGLASFSLGLLFKIEHWPCSFELLIASPALLFLVYFPMYMMNQSISIEKQTNYLRSAFMTIIVGCVLVFFIYRIAIELNKPKSETTEQILVK